MNFNGTNGNDKITTGNSGSDTYNEGRGYDVVKDYWGNDTYTFNRGDQWDSVTDSNGADVISFGDGITASDLTFKRELNNVIISINGTADGITIVDWFTNGKYKIEEIKFSNGSTLSYQDVENAINGIIPGAINGTEGNDTINGTADNDTIFAKGGDDVVYGQEGNDTLWGNDGNDVLVGGQGNNIIHGGAGNDSLRNEGGNDTYYFNKGDGQDVIYDLNGTDRIKLGAGILPEDTDITADMFSSVIIKIKNSEDQITIDSGRWDYSKIENLEFADGTVWDISSHLQGKTAEGTEGNDNLNGTWLKDTLDGKAGNDTLNGYAGNDIYIFNKGDGQDTINDWDRTDINVIKFGPGITFNDINITQQLDFSQESFGIRTTRTLLAKIKGSTDQIDFSNGNIGHLEFQNGTRVEVKNIIDTTGTNANDALTGTSSSDKIVGLDGDDTITGNKSNDFLEGGNGKDTYVFNKGDGEDFIADGYNNETNIIKFGQNISKDDIVIDEHYRTSRIPGVGFEYQYVSANIGIKNSTDYIYLDGDAYNYQLQFADGTITDVNSLVPVVIDGTSDNDSLTGNSKSNLIRAFEGDDIVIDDLGGDDTIYGGAGNDTIYGGFDNDTLYGDDGDDRIEGGFGDDTIYDGDGSDTIRAGAGNDRIILAAKSPNNDISGTNNILFNRGDGQDTVQADRIGQAYTNITFGPDIKKEDIQVTSSTVFPDNEYVVDGYSREITVGIRGTNDNISMQVHDAYGEYYVHPEFFLSDGTKLNIEEFLATDPTVVGTNENDKFSNYNGNDIYYAKAGYDIIKDYYGNDTYLLNKNDLWDTITDSQGSDTVKLGDSITLADLSFTRSGNNLNLSFKGSSDGMTVINWFSANKYQIENFELSNGSNLTNTQINSMV